jgi:hypothetical protein
MPKSGIEKARRKRKRGVVVVEVNESASRAAPAAAAAPVRPPASLPAPLGPPVIVISGRTLRKTTFATCLAADASYGTGWICDGCGQDQQRQPTLWHGEAVAGELGGFDCCESCAVRTGAAAGEASAPRAEDGPASSGEEEAGPSGFLASFKAASLNSSSSESEEDEVDGAARALGEQLRAVAAEGDCSALAALIGSSGSAGGAVDARDWVRVRARRLRRYAAVEAPGPGFGAGRLECAAARDEQPQGGRGSAAAATRGERPHHGRELRHRSLRLCVQPPAWLTVSSRCAERQVDGTPRGVLE